MQPKDIVLCRIYQRKQNQEDKKSQSLQVRDIITNDNDYTSSDFSKDGNQPKRKLPSIPDLNVQSNCSNNHVSEPQCLQEASKSIVDDQELPFSKRKRSRTSGPDGTPCDETSQSQLMMISQEKPRGWMNVSDFLERRNSLTLTRSEKEKFLIQYRASPTDKVEQYFVCPNCKDEGGELTGTLKEKGKSLVFGAGENDSKAEQKSLIGLNSEVNRNGELNVGNIEQEQNESQIGRIEGSIARGDAVSGDGSSSSSS